MDAENRFVKCFYVYERFYLRVAGHDVLIENFKPTLYSYFLYLYFCFFIFLNFYSLFIVETLLQRMSVIAFLLISIMVKKNHSLNKSK